MEKIKQGFSKAFNLVEDKIAKRVAGFMKEVAALVVSMKGKY